MTHQSPNEDPDAQSKRRWRIAALIAAGVVALVIAVWVVVSMLGSDDDQAATPTGSPSPTATSEAVPDDTAEQTPEPTDDETAAEPEVEATDDEIGWSMSGEAPDPSLAEGRTWTATFDTSVGEIVVELDGAAAPQAVASFVALADEGFFNQTECHRLTTAGIYVLQCGDPIGNGTGGPSYRYGPIENAPEDDMYPAGTLAMARVGQDGNSMGSQFFLVYQDSMIPSDSAGGYTVFGQVTEGLSIVEDVASAGTITGQPDGRPAQSVIVNEVSLS